jgi:hypothetical protein
MGTETRKPMRHALRTILSVLPSLPALFSCSDEARNPNQPITGSLEITTATAGQPSSGEGFSYVLDGNPAVPIAFNTTIQLSGLLVGAHTVELTSLPEGCSVVTSNPLTVGVTEDVAGTALFEVSCVPAGIGNIEVTASTTGPAPSNYSLLLNGENQGIIAANGTQVLPDIPAGSHAVGLADIPANCQLEETDPQIVPVAADEIAKLSFTLACTAPPAQSGVLAITTSTTGVDPDGYLVSIDGGPVQPISINGALTITNVAPRDYSIQLADLDGSCTVTGGNPVNVTVSDGEIARPAFEITCGT